MIISQFYKLKNINKEKLIVVKNIFYSGFGQVINYITPLLILPIIVERIGLEKVGVYSMLLTIFASFNLTIGFGFTLSTVRHVAGVKNREELNTFVGGVFFSKVFNALITIVPFLIFLKSYSALNEYFNWIALSGILYCLGLVLYQDWLLVGLQRAEYQFVALFTSRAIYIYIVFFTGFANSIASFIFLESVLSITIGVLTLVQLYYFSDIKINIIDFQTVKNIWKEGLVAFSSYFFVYLYSSINILIFGLIGSKEDLGLYSFIDRVYLIFMGGFAIVLRSLFPYLSKAYLTNKADYYRVTTKICKNLFLFLSLFLLMLLVLRNPILQIITRGTVGLDKMSLLSKVFIATLVVILLHTCTSFLSYTFYINHTEKKLLKILIIVALTNLLLSYPILTYMGLIGIPVLLTINYSLCIALQLYHFHKSKNQTITN